MEAKMKSFFRSVSKNKTDIVLIMMWAALLSFLVIRTYWISYNTSERLMYQRPLFPTYDLQRLEFLDLVAVFVSGIVIGLFLSDVKAMIYGYIGAISLSFFFSVVYITIYIWYILDFGPLFSAFAYDWELAVYAATSISFAIMVPWMVGFCLVGLAIGAFVRTLVGWS